MALLLNAGLLRAQSRTDFENLKRKYPSEDLIVLNKKEYVSLEVVKGKLEIEATHYYEVMFMSDKAPNLAENSVGYSAYFQDINNLEAYSLIPDAAGQYKKIQVKNIKTTDNRSSSVFFDDQKQKEFMFEGVKKGAIGVYSYKEKLKDPHLFGSFIFKQYVPILNAEYSVSFPSEIALTYKTFGDQSLINFTEKKSRNRTQYFWKGSDLPKIPYESDAPSLQYYAPQVLTLINSYQNSNLKVDVLKNVDQLYKWYVSMIKDVNQSPGTELKSLVDSLTKGKSEIDKIKSIYYWVQDNVKYIAFEDGLGGFVPREANAVVSKRFGDCKDMAGTITTMLNIAGIKAHPTWIGTRDIPFRYEENPSPRTDNHMISAVKINDKWQFLDGTNTWLDYGISAEAIQGKEALIMITPEQYEVAQVPVENRNVNYEKDSISLKIDQNRVIGKGKIVFGGLWKTDILNNYSRATDKERESYLKSLCTKGSNKCKLDNVKPVDFNKRDIPASIDYTYSIDDYVRKIDDEIMINPCLNKRLIKANIDIENKKLDYEENYHFITQQVLTIETPKGYKLNYLPNNASYKKDLFGFTITYTVVGETIKVVVDINADYLLLKPEKFTEWNEMISALNESYNELITFKKI
ncbi:DUF3857 and transglutaminase domain-containing protein [Solitalea sp. MAHUQ-68]|uniref:DUF3857 and transglutaminase domain-containing protein n=1 Tax=Solitalea agri TaxID=2953739 RepID=A0A9X2F9U7_9SPHI|nr:DUF3857 domain-containing protein [Solitalea agri]MCO4294498.1 DUF3857 and transglutaminase domain-containing protein [Solitalea agri]